MTHEEIMKLGAEEAEYTMKHNIGGPFGAVVVKDGEVIAVASNSVLRDNDPTAHAEINAIRLACKNLGTYDLSGCELCATGSPCPMCLSAIMWANIKKVYVSGSAEDAAKIGFRDWDMFYIIENCNNGDPSIEDRDTIQYEYVNSDIAKNLYNEYAEMQKKMYQILSTFYNITNYVMEVDHEKKSIDYFSRAT